MTSGYDYVVQSDITTDWLLDVVGGDFNGWNGGPNGSHIWTIDLISQSSYYDANYPYLGKLYKIQSTLTNTVFSGGEDVGEHMYFQGSGPGYSTAYGGPVDNDDRYIEVLGQYLDETPRRVEVRIYAYRDGQLVVLDAVNDNDHSNYPTVDTNLQVGEYGHPIWYPISQLNASNNNNVWDMLLDPSDDSMS
jgi:hypothetical protein